LEIELWEGGLLAHEVDAIERIEKHFTDNKKNKTNKVTQGSFKEQLSQIKGDSIFPWKGYAGFRFVDKGKEGEFDLVIVTHCNVLIIELKDWNRGEITAHGDKWFKNDQEMGRSPVSVTRNKKFLLEKKLRSYKNQFSNKGRVPFVHFLVVMTGNAGFDKLPDTDKEHTISLQDFLNFKNEHVFNKKFKPHPDSKVLNNDFHVFEKLLDRRNAAPKHIIINGYKAVEVVFPHPNGIYKEFSAVSEASNKDEALLRLWDFNKVTGRKAKTSEGRFEIVSREREVLGSIKNLNYDLYKYCLTSLTSVQKDEVTAQYSELYELPPSHVRFNEFIGKFGVSFTEVDRLTLVKLLFAKFADLHKLNIAHRDLGDHSIWISPSKEIALSNFISAYHQPLGTVGDYRDILSVNNGSTPFGMPVTNKTTPFQIDVYTLAVVAWHIMQGRRIDSKSLEDLPNEIEESSYWYDLVLIEALQQNLKDADVLFAALKSAEPKNKQNLDFDETELEPYKHNIKVSRQYPEDELITETDEKEVYVSNGLIVKEWLNVNPGSGIQIGYRTLHFLQRIAKLKSLSPPYLPNIHEFGIATRTDSLFLVMEKVTGVKWTDVTPNVERLNLVHGLVSAIEHLHGLHISHGDLHPENILVDISTESVSLIDIPDFSLSQGDIKNHKYSPDNIDGCTSFERDNYAVMRLCVEVLGLKWGEQTEDISEKHKVNSLELSGLTSLRQPEALPAVSEAVLLELNDLEYGFKSLERFKNAIKSPFIDDKIEFIDITVQGQFETLEIFPDNGKLYLDIEKSDRDPNQARIVFKGVGGNVALIYIPFQSIFKIGFKPQVRSSVSRRDIESAKLELPFGLRVKAGQYSSLESLNKRLEDNKELERAVDLVLVPPIEDNNEDVINLVEDTPEKNESIDITTHQLWKSILETETESHPHIELIETQKHKENQDQMMLHHKSESDPLASFSKTDEIEALLVKGDNEQVLGEVLLKLSTLTEIRLSKLRNSANRLNENDVIYFRSKQDKASFTKRKNALERILARESTINELVEYFEPSTKLDATSYGIDVTEDDFKRYNRTDEHGNEISLNNQQREAFQKLVNNGPLSLLQGPPGTGKTEFIAAFVHYLVEKQQVNNILLVSQSHEAVNTAAERIRKHCLRLDTNLDVVRFSNREATVSNGLKDVYSNALITEKRELFSAEATYRTQALSQALGLQPQYLAEITKVELRLFKQIDELSDLADSLGRSNLNDKDKKGLVKSHQELESMIRITLKEDYLICIDDIELSKIKDMVWSKLQKDYSIRPDEAKKARALAKISRDMLEVLATDRVNYDEFFARSRQLVTGTCVGIGQHHIGISENQYDWVIIDEAARSIASELAIAMQSGKRILLVGDHKQLPPLYSEPHKQALARKLGLVSKDSEGLLQSDFARAFESHYGKQASAQLLTQYRMAKPIGDLVSTCFYDGELATGKRNIPDIYSNAPNALRNIVTWLDTSSLGKRSHHGNDRGGPYDIYNRAEADEIIALLKSIAENESFTKSLIKTSKGGEPAIGIICTYAEQKRFLRQKFKEQIWEDDFKALVKIDTVDSYQGKENRIIILSITRSCPKLSTGFLYLPNRINVALSRAMDRLVIVGASQMWRGKNKNKPLGPVLEFIELNTAPGIYKVLNVNAKKGQGGKK
jgi:serine/threonine protein kinase